LSGAFRIVPFLRLVHFRTPPTYGPLLVFAIDLQGVAEAAEETFFERAGIARHGDAGAVAFEAKFEEFAIEAFEQADAIVAPPVFAFRAAEGGGEFAMGEAGGRAIFEESSAGGLLEVDFGNGDVDVGEFDGEVDIAEREQIAFLENGFADRLLVNERAVGGIEIPDRGGDFRDLNFAMKARDARFGNGNVVVGIATDAVQSFFEFDFAPCLAASLDRELCHELG
jgi:hypothetical protein